jgi:hypothetical protein
MTRFQYEPARVAVSRANGRWPPSWSGTKSDPSRSRFALFSYSPGRPATTLAAARVRPPRCRCRLRLRLPAGERLAHVVVGGTVVAADRAGTISLGDRHGTVDVRATLRVSG